MTFFFRKRKVEWQNDASQKTVEWLNNKLRSFAACLSRKTESVQPRTMAVIILASCLFFSVCLSIAVIKTNSISREKPVSSIRAPLIKLYRQKKPSNALLRRIRHFHQQLDSLRQNDFLRYDSLMKSRPHLLDSMLTAEQLLNK